MSIVFQNFSDGTMGQVGRDGGRGDTEFITSEWTAASVDKVIYIAPRQIAVQSINARVTVAGTGGAATFIVRKVPSGTAITAGTALHSGTFNIVGTVDTNQAGVLSTTESDLILAAGDSIAIDFTGTLTSATGVVTVGANPR